MRKKRIVGILGVLAVGLGLCLSGPGCSGQAKEVAFEKISENLYRVSDACNVYVIKSGDRALLIDSGDGLVLEVLKEMGVRKIDWVFHTHSHRDQCQGTPRLVEAGAKVAVPEKEERFFTEVQSFWNDFQIYIRYRFKPDSFKPRENITVHRTLAQGDLFEWEGLRIEVVETPGHTLGAVSYLAEIDGVRYAFTGDMIHSPGKVWNLWSFDYRYWDGGFKGITLTLEGLDKVLAKQAAVLLPSHGVTIRNPADAAALLKTNLEGIYDFGPEPEENVRPSSRPSTRWRKISQHLYHYRPTSFILLSEDGSALFYDYYAVPGENHRYGYDTIEPVIEALGIKTVDVVIPSHFHEDHIRGFLDLKRRFGTSIWVYENMVDILENPSRYNLPCLAPEKIKADRVLCDGELLNWKEYEFAVMHFPGQTMYHQAMTGVVDGRKVFFMGDTDCYELDNVELHRRNLRLHGISTFLNYYLLEPEGGYIKTMNKLVEHDPELLLFAHSGAREGNMEMYLKNLENIKKRIAAVAKVLPHEDPNLGFDPNWIHFYPYTKKIEHGSEFETEIRVRNHLARMMNARVSLRLPEGWSAEPGEGNLAIEGKAEGSLFFRVKVPESAKLQKRTVITANVVTDGQNWGEFAEMLLDVE